MSFFSSSFAWKKKKRVLGKEVVVEAIGDHTSAVCCVDRTVSSVWIFELVSLLHILCFPSVSTTSPLIRFPRL